jgi:F1F0 ATPase subunit 2
MREALTGPVVALLAGGALGLVFFGGLWWTVQRAASFRHPGLAVLLSLVLRTGVTLAGFLLVAGDQWPRWLLCLLGFVTARWLVARALRAGAAGVRHAA